MNKKFLSVILFSALMVGTAGTFTSCKDYDDDINNLQEQIDGQNGLSAKITAVESSISNLQSAQSGLQGVKSLLQKTRLQRLPLQHKKLLLLQQRLNWKKSKPSCKRPTKPV